MRLLMRVRDSILSMLPKPITQTIVNLGLPLSGMYGLYWNKGFSFSELSAIYSDTGMEIIDCKWLKERFLVAITASPLP